MTNRTSDEQAIRDAISAVEAGWNARDGKQFAAPFAEDADYVIVDGNYIKGRQIIAAGHQQIFDTVYRDTRYAATVHGIRFLADDVAVAHVEWNLTFLQNAAVQKAMATAVMTEADGAWSIAAYHNTPIVSR